jgi:protein tyrosine phosphatase (PTP) superfamily phosphohydrolase (DUF442 family)
MCVEELLNFYQITEHIGTAGQPTAEQLNQVAEQGYSAVVNLAMHDSDNAIPEEGNIVSSLGMSYFHIPVPFDNPTAGHLKKFIGIMDVLDGEKVFVHCAVNARVSAFMYKYLTFRKSRTEESATSPLLKQWLPQMDGAWKSIMSLSAEDVEL